MRKTWCKTPSEIEYIEKYDAAANEEERQRISKEYDRECAEYFEWLHSFNTPEGDKNRKARLTQ
jgi:hypothetical protein